MPNEINFGIQTVKNVYGLQDIVFFLHFYNMTSTKEISAEWESWIVSNLERGINRDYIFNTLLENGFSYDTVRKKLGFDLEIKQEIPQNWKDWIEEN